MPFLFSCITALRPEGQLAKSLVAPITLRCLIDLSMVVEPDRWSVVTTAEAFATKSRRIGPTAQELLTASSFDPGTAPRSDCSDHRSTPRRKPPPCDGLSRLLLVVQLHPRREAGVIVVLAQRGVRAVDHARVVTYRLRERRREGRAVVRLDGRVEPTPLEGVERRRREWRDS